MRYTVHYYQVPPVTSFHRVGSNETLALMAALIVIRTTFIDAYFFLKCNKNASLDPHLGVRASECALAYP